MRSRNGAFAWLLHKEWRELVASRAWWLMLVLIGPLVGVSFISAVRTYAELSGLNGTSAGVGEAFSPLIGVWAPTFSACEIAAAFLLPFVAIRVAAGDRQSGALKLELQHPMPISARVIAKALVLTAGWIVSLAPGALAVLLWRGYGGSVYVPELLTIAAGHILNASLTIALAMAASAVTDHPSTAAIVTLSVTVGTWILNFIAAVHGGIWERAAGFTPTAMVAQFQHGLIRLDVAVAAGLFAAAGLVFAAIWTRLGLPVRRRVYESLAAAAVIAIAIAASARLTASWDTSENRMNSFRASDERALKQITSPLRIEVHLAPEDPRRVDLERQALAKLRRVLPHVHVDYVSQTSTGLFEQTSQHYGEIWYRLGDRAAMSRVTTVEGVLETIYSLAGISPPPEDADEPFRGHPLATQPRGAPWVFYVFWPVAIVISATLLRRKSS